MKNLTSFSDIGAQFRNLNGRHPGQWPLVPRALCGVGVLAAVLFLGWFLYWSGQLEELDAGHQKEQQLRDAYKIKIQQAVNLDALRKQKEQVSEYVSTLEKQLPSKAEMDALLSDINQAGLGRGLQFELFKPGQVVVKDYYAELPIDIKITGSYHDIGAFTGDIANLPRIVTLNNLDLSATKDGTMTLEAIAKTFRYLDKEEVAAQRKAEAAKKGAKK
ncbi:type IV pilus inner membrane component PilO [Noviherbaspirillum pedocola]|uniref:Type 4a pilus biogenesis protein PilO n=1 Tax=Noviherbaspirillum pedocola TaxID=2801341 RepID=A0A934SW95_9BURK|nr:type 4a pilus biogenesis protein PilO [Noviherbaspirillum pedocola]MBK4733859.1 type 4a pilus biogenesis protein PilO [Noviherbaspirillum pedocola]